VVDIDGESAQAVLEQLAAQHGAIPTTRTVSTGRGGGRHLWLRIPSDEDLGNTAGRLGAGIDTRGRGGYVLAPPSRHPSGRRYTWEEAAETPIAEAPDWILERLRASNGNGKPAAAGPPTGVDPHRLRAFGDTVLARELEALSQHSHEPGTGRGTALYTAAVRLGRLVSGNALELQTVWERLEAAGRHLELDEPEIQRSVQRGLDAGFDKPLELRDRPRSVEPTRAAPHSRKSAGGADSDAQRSDEMPLDQPQTLQKSAEDEWPKILRPTPPPFPLDALPSSVATFAQAVAAAHETPVDLGAIAALGVLSAAALGIVVECGPALTQELALYLIVAMPSGDRKSTVLSAAVAPLRKLLAETREAAKAEVRERKLRRDLLEARKSKLIRNMKVDDDPEQHTALESELARIAEELEEIGEPELPRLLANDVTPETLGGLLAKYARAAVIAAEAPFISNILGRYDSTGAANLDLVCAAYEGEASEVDRRNREELLERPLLTVMLTVQPHVLRGLVEHETARDQGLVGRFAFAVPESLLGRRRHHDAPISPQAQRAWEELIRTVYSRNPLTETTQPPTQAISVGSVSTREIGGLKLLLSPSARKLLHELRVSHEARLAEDGDLRPHAAWIARHPGRVARIAALLHLADQPGEVVDEETMQRALRIGDYLLAHGLAVLTEPDPMVRRALRWLERQVETTVTVRDLHRGPLGSRGPAGPAHELAARLIEHGALRPLTNEEPRSGPGQPPSPRFAINPHLRRAHDQENEPPREAAA
jgi:hypothetical protein